MNMYKEERTAQDQPVDVALRAAQMGFPVFPIKPEDKSPFVKWTLTSTRDPEVIKDFWNGFPNAMVGAVTGWVSGYFVLDIDVKDGKEAFEKLNDFVSSVGTEPLPTTMIVQTPSSGLHLYFKMPKGVDIRNSAGELGKGIDIRANGGYVAFLGSVRADGKSYQLIQGDNQNIADAPQWLIEACLNQSKAQRSHSSHPTGRLFSNGRRNADMASIAGFLNKKGATPEQVGASLHALNDGVLHEPLDEKEVANIAASINRYDSKILFAKDTYTHLGFSKLIAERFKDKVLHCVGHGFYHYDGERWIYDTNDYKSMSICKSLVDEIWTDIEVLDEKTFPEEVIRRIKGQALILKSTPFINSSLKLVKSDASLDIKMEDFDSNKNLLNLKNGTFDLGTGVLKPHNPDDKMTHLLDFEYDAKAKSPIFSKFMADILPEDKVKFLLRIFGYALTGTGNEQMFFILQGGGKNGKSTFLNAMEEIFGGMSVNIQPETLNGKMDGSIRNDLARLAGKRLLTTSETKSGTILDAPLMKQITGQDTLTARMLYKEPFEFKPICVPVIVTNFLPVVDGSDYAMERRVCVITFDKKIANADTHLQNKLKEEKSGIFNLLLDGLKDYQSHGGLAIPASVEEKTKKFTESSNLIRDFIQECLKEDNDRSVGANDLYREYSRWTTDSGCKPMSMPVFKTTFERETGIEQERNSGGKIWKGYSLKYPPRQWIPAVVRE